MAQGWGHPAVVRVAVFLFAFVVGPIMVSTMLASVAGAAQLQQPANASPYHVALDAGSHPAPFTIAVAGFAAGQQVFVEQCDGTSPSTPNWDPTINCDPGSSPAPVVADADGRAVFIADSANHRFTPFVGRSPQDEFSCTTTCQVRVSSNNAASTTDQVMFSIALPAGATPPPVAGVTTSTVATAKVAGTTSSRPAGATTTTKAGAHRTTKATRPKSHKGTSTTGGRLAGRGSSAAGGSSSGGGPSAGSVGWLIGGLVIASGAAGYVWAWRRKRALAAS